jgi:hypothetical protein
MHISGAVLPPEMCIYWQSPVHGATITRVTVLANATCEASFGIRKTTFSTFNSGWTNIVGATSGPVLNNTLKYTNSGLSGWTLGFTGGDIFELKFNGLTSGNPSSISLIISYNAS